MLRATFVRGVVAAFGFRPAQNRACDPRGRKEDESRIGIVPAFVDRGLYLPRHIRTPSLPRAAHGTLKKLPHLREVKPAGASYSQPIALTAEPDLGQPGAIPCDPGA